MTARSLYRVYDGESRGNLPETYTSPASADWQGAQLAADAREYGKPVAVGQAMEDWSSVYATDGEVRSLGAGPGVDGVWLSAWWDLGDNTIHVVDENGNHKSESWTRDSQPEWLASADQSASDLYAVRAGHILPGGAWIVWCEHKTGSAGSWTTVGQALGLAQGLTYANFFSAARSIEVECAGLVETATATAYPHTRGRAWCVAANPILSGGEVRGAYFGAADYIIDTSQTVAKPGGQAWGFAFSCAADQTGWALDASRKLHEVEEDGLHCHAVWPVQHATGELDWIVSCGDNPAHNRLLRVRVDDPSDLAGSTLTTQTDFGPTKDTGQSQPLSPVLGSAANKSLWGTDIEDMPLLEIECSATITDQAIIRSVGPLRWSGTVKTSGGHTVATDKAWTEVLHLRCANPWDSAARRQYVAGLRTHSAHAIYPDAASTVAVSLGGERWFECASEPDGRAVAIVGASLVAGATSSGAGGTGGGIRRLAGLPGYTTQQPLIIGPGGVNLLSTLAIGVSSLDADATVKELSYTSSAWRDTDDATALDPQPPITSGARLFHVLSTSPAAPLVGYFKWITNVNPPTDNFAAGKASARLYVRAAGADQRPNLWMGISRHGSAHNMVQVRAGSTQDWLPVLLAVDYDPDGDASDFNCTLTIQSFYNDEGERGVVKFPAAFYLALDTVLHEDDQTPYPGLRIDAGATAASRVQTWTLPAADALTVGLNLALPFDAPDSTFGYSLCKTGTTTWLSLYADASNKIELVLDRANEQWLLQITEDGTLEDTITLSSAWASADGLINVRLSHDADGVRIALLQNGNEVIAGSSASFVDVDLTTLRIGNQAGTDMPLVGVLSVWWEDRAWTAAELARSARRSHPHIHRPQPRRLERD